MFSASEGQCHGEEEGHEDREAQVLPLRVEEDLEELLRRPGPGRPSWLRSQRQTPSRTRDAEVRPLPELLQVLEEPDGLLVLVRHEKGQEGRETRRPRTPKMPAAASAGAAESRRRRPTSLALRLLQA